MQGLDLAFRALTIADIDELQTLARSTFIATYAAVNTPENMRNYLEVDLGKPKLKEELQSKQSKFYFLEKSATPIAYIKLNFGNCAAWKQSNESGLEIERIYVTENFQRAGIGKILLSYIEQIAMNNQCDYIWLGVWENNIKALGFYQKNKFEKIGLHVFHLGKDAQTDWLMAKKTSQIQ